MSAAESNLHQLLRTLTPEVRQHPVAYISIPPSDPVPVVATLATVAEPEGTTLVLDSTLASQLDYPILFEAAWITLRVHSDLAAVGLTAAVSQALAKVSIPCNIIAGAHHDHVLVPYHQREPALACLQKLQRSASR